MNKVLFIVAIFLIFVGFITVYESGNTEAYEASVQETIEDRLTYLRTSDESPFQKFDAAFKRPEYFPINQDYRVNAKLERIKTREYFIIENSDGTKDRYQRFAKAKFQLKGIACELIILKLAGLGSMNQYFLGFADETSAVSTYGGGRYLDVEVGKSNKVVLDFNLAYNPYCAYVDGFVCPLPPKENILPMAIEAGEKDYLH